MGVFSTFTSSCNGRNEQLKAGGNWKWRMATEKKWEVHLRKVRGCHLQRLGGSLHNIQYIFFVCRNELICRNRFNTARTRDNWPANDGFKNPAGWSGDPSMHINVLAWKKKGYVSLPPENSANVGYTLW
jgi:hypothetical protein